jgi:hypothetical protein
MKVVVSKGANGGIGDHLTCLFGSWWYAKQTGRKLIIDWRGSRYSSQKHANAFNEIYSCGSTLAGVQVICDERISRFHYERPIYPSKWNVESLLGTDHEGHDQTEIDYSSNLVKTGRDKDDPTVVFNQHFTSDVLPAFHLQSVVKELVLHPELNQRVGEFAHRNFHNKKVIGVHLRHGNGEDIQSRTRYWYSALSLTAYLWRKIFGQYKPLKRTNIGSTPAVTGGELRVFRQVLAHVEKIGLRLDPRKTVVFLCTDNAHVVRYLKQHLEHIVVYDKYFRPDSEGGLLYMDQDSIGSVSASIPKEKQIVEDMLIEQHLLNHCDHLVSIPSQFTCMVNILLSEENKSALRPTLINRIIWKLFGNLASKGIHKPKNNCPA